MLNFGVSEWALVLGGIEIPVASAIPLSSGLLAAIDAMAKAANIQIVNGLWRPSSQRRIRS